MACQVAPQNVVIQFINYGSDDGLPVGEVIGQGAAWVLTAGHIIEGTWVKPAPEAVTQYLDAAGAPIKLTPGRTWVALPPPGGPTSITALSRLSRCGHPATPAGADGAFRRARNWRPCLSRRATRPVPPA